MKFRKTAGERQDSVELQMTAMIDIVFQLLIFFIMTFKIVQLEGDFNIKMPLPSEATDPLDAPPIPPIKVRLIAGAGGGLAEIQMNGLSLGTDFEALRQQLISIVGTDTGPGSIAAETEVEIDADYNLTYDNTIAAITAVSGQVQNGNLVRLVENIKFAPPRKPAG